MDNNIKKSSKLKIVTFILMILLVLTGTSFAVITWSYNGKNNNLLSTPDVSFRFLESNKEIIGIDNGIPMTDSDGMKQSGTSNVFDFEVRSKFNASTDVKYTVSLEKLSIDSGKSQIPDDEIKVYVEDFEGKTVMGPSKISELDNYNLFVKTDRHDKDNEEISSKYRLKVWLDESVDVFNNQNRQYKFRINVSTNEEEQDPNQSYNLTYNLNGGTGNISNTSFKVGSKVTITNVIPTKEGYEFLGWSSNKNSNTAEYTSGQQVNLTNAYNNTVTLYAVWNKSITYKVRYNPNGGLIKGVQTLEPDVNYFPEELGSNPFKWTKDGDVYKRLNWSTITDTSYLIHPITITSTTTLSYEIAVSQQEGAYAIVGITSSTFDREVYITEIAATPGITSEADLQYKKYEYTLEPGSYYFVVGLESMPSLSAEGLDGVFVKNIQMPGYVEKLVEDSTFVGKESNKLKKNEYERPHYVFKGWSLDSNATSATYTDEQVVNALTTKDNDVVNLYAVWEKEKYKVDVVVQNGTITGSASKTVNYNENATFNVSPISSDYAMQVVSCTNNQVGTIDNGIVTVSNVSSDTVCKVAFNSDAVTTLYSDNTLIINESVADRNQNISKHGTVLEEYEAYSDSNSYVFADDNHAPWLKSDYYKQIFNVEVGQIIQPVSTSYWFYNIHNLKTADVSNLDTSNVESMVRMFEYAGDNSNSDTFNIKGLESWNVSNVISMKEMFYEAGINATNFSIGNLEKWNVTKNTNTDCAFYGTGEASGYVPPTWYSGCKLA